MDGWKDGTIVPTFQRSIGPPDPLAHSPGRHPPGAAGGGPAPDLRPRLLDRPRDRRPVRRRAEALMYEMLASLEPRLPPAGPRYLMGVGFPEDLVAATERGIDLFDCVAPTRNGRNGSAFTPDGPVNIRNAEHREDARPLDATCDCETCTTFSRGYLRHLFAAEELLGLRLLSLHNGRFLLRPPAAMRAPIRAGTFPRWAAEWRHRYTRSD